MCIYIYIYIYVYVYIYNYLKTLVQGHLEYMDSFLSVCIETPIYCPTFFKQSLQSTQG